MNPLDSITEQIELIKDINAILKKYQINETILLQDITITDNGVNDLIKQTAKLSDAITNFLWPSVHFSSVYHYTSKDNAEKILNTDIFRLTNIAKRYREGEITTFCNTHQLSGYLGLNKNGIQNDKELIENTFYASFTDTNLTVNEEEYFWRQFASNGGVRLRINITAKNDNFRKIYYEQVKGKQIPLLLDLSSLINQKYKRKFTLKGISRLCSFYLSGDDYGMEREYRLLHRVWDHSGPQPKTDGYYSYIELPLNTMAVCGYEMKVVEVQSDESLDIPSTYIFSKRQS